jgi:hypothetical protein
MLMAVLAQQGFPEHVQKFFASYLVGRGMRYLWNLFSSDRRSTDVGVGQGSTLSPVLSALYLAPVIKHHFFTQYHHLHPGQTSVNNFVAVLYVPHSCPCQYNLFEITYP